MASVSVFAIIIAGTTALLVMLLRMCNNLTAGTMSAIDASLAIGRVAQNVRQAQKFDLMIPEEGYGTTYYAPNPSSTSNIVVTGVRIYAPSAASSTIIAVGGTSGNVTLAGTSALANPKETGATLDFYRSDTSGNPAPTTGTCLWMKGTENGLAVNRALVKTVAPAWNAVQFVQPYMADGTTPLPNAVTIKLTCAYYSRINGSVSSDSGKGGVTQVTGECIYLRNHDPNGVTSTGAQGKSLL